MSKQLVCIAPNNDPILRFKDTAEAAEFLDYDSYKRVIELITNNGKASGHKMRFINEYEISMLEHVPMFESGATLAQLLYNKQVRTDEVVFVEPVENLCEAVESEDEESVIKAVKDVLDVMTRENEEVSSDELKTVSEDESIPTNDELEEEQGIFIIVDSSMVDFVICLRDKITAKIKGEKQTLRFCGSWSEVDGVITLKSY